MTLEKPTRRELVSKLQAAIESRLSDAQLRHSDAKVYARAFAGTADALYSLISYMHRQQFVFSCDSEYLDRHGSLYGVARIAATKAHATVQFDAVDGAVVSAGAIVQTESGQRFVTLTDSDSDGAAEIEAEVAGTAGNLPAGTIVTLTAPVEGVDGTATLATAGTGGADIESDESYRSRILLRMREQPMGGSASDYVNWARQVPGVTRAWCYPEESGAGTVTVRFMCDDSTPAIPSDEMVKEVKAHIDSLRPVTAKVTVMAPVAEPVAIKFADITPDTELVRAQIKAELQALFKREAEPGVRLPISHIRAAISSAAGETDYRMTAPTTDIQPATGAIPVLGPITWQA